MGKNKYIETPEKMYELFCAYKKQTKANPIKKMDFKGKEVETVFYELEVCLTMEGFEIYVADQPNMPFGLEHYFANTDGKYKNYCTICSRIRMEIRNDQIIGGMAGIYNPSITQRLNGLVDKQEMKTTEVKPIETIRKSDKK